MNKQFARRQAEVLEILKLLAIEAADKKKTLVFIGGSAIQVALLKQPKRLSVDLDIYYNGAAEELIGVLRKDYVIEKRKTKRGDLFDFYTVVREGVQVKVDIAKFNLVDKGKPWEKRALGRGKFKAGVATSDYLLAAKLSALAIGTVGRRQFHQIDFLKDVFDANALLDEFRLSARAISYFWQICKIQNGINVASFSELQIIESMAKALLSSVNTDDVKSTIRKADLGNFNEYLVGHALRKIDYWTMACRLIAYARSLALKDGALQAIRVIEKDVRGKYASREFVSTCEERLKEKGIDASLLHELKIVAPKALAYLYYAHHLPGVIRAV